MDGSKFHKNKHKNLKRRYRRTAMRFGVVYQSLTRRRAWAAAQEARAAIATA